MGISNANTFVCRMLWMYCVIDKSQSPFLDVFYPQYLEPLNISVASAPSTVISDNEDCLLIYVKYLCCIERTTQILKVALGVSPVFFLYSCVKLALLSLNIDSDWMICRRAFTTTCLDYVANYLVDLQTKRSTPQQAVVVGNFKRLQAQLERF